jgi:hypothetical protein
MAFKFTSSKNVLWLRYPYSVYFESYLIDIPILSVCIPILLEEFCVSDTLFMFYPIYIPILLEELCVSGNNTWEPPVWEASTSCDCWFSICLRFPLKPLLWEMLHASFCWSSDCLVPPCSLTMLFSFSFEHHLWRWRNSTLYIYIDMYQ